MIRNIKKLELELSSDELLSLMLDQEERINELLNFVEYLIGLACNIADIPEIDDRLIHHKDGHVGYKIKIPYLRDKAHKNIRGHHRNSDKNPFRKSEGINEYSDKELKLIQDDVSLQIDREIFDLQKSDKSLDDEKNVSELVQFAAKESLRVPIAYKVMNYDRLVEQINSLTTELKETNKELSLLSCEKEILAVYLQQITTQG